MRVILANGILRLKVNNLVGEKRHHVFHASGLKILECGEVKRALQRYHLKRRHHRRGFSELDGCRKQQRPWITDASAVKAVPVMFIGQILKI